MTPNETLQNARKSILTWNHLVEQVEDPVDDLLYYARQLWQEDKDVWNEARRKTLRGEWNLQQFDDQLHALQQKQTPIWKIIVDRQAKLKSQLTELHAQLQQAHEAVKSCLVEDPVTKKYLNPLAHLLGKPLHVDQMEMHSNYHYQLRRQFEDAQEDYERLCGNPWGILTRVKIMAMRVPEQSAQRHEMVHKRISSPVGYGNMNSIDVA